MNIEEERRRYWQTNKKIIAVLLSIWFLASCVLGIFLVGPLDKFHIAGFPLGFWFAQQGAIYIFIILIGAYCVLMDRQDRKFHVDESTEGPGE